MKKLGCILLALMIVFSGVSALAAEQGTSTEPYESLTVSSPNAMSGNFMNSLWGANSSDLDIQALLHGYPLVVWNQEQGSYMTNDTVVSGMVITKDAAGNHVYHIDLYQDLLYSDGTPITARDYAFSILMMMDPVIGKIGGKIGSLQGILGAQDYVKGETRTFSGVRLLGEYALEVVLDAAYLPNFFEMSLLAVKPYPISVIAPNCKVVDHGEGAMICDDNEDETDINWNEQDLNRTLLRQTGYVHRPDVVSGPYRLLSVEGRQNLILTINENYKGNPQGVKPKIETLNFIAGASSERLLQRLSNGRLGLFNKCVAADSVLKGISMARDGKCNMNSYARSGLSMISFCCENPTVSSAAVRQAIACCLDADSIIQQYVGGYGLRVNGYYGIGQWMVRLLNGSNTLETGNKDQMQAFEDLSMDQLTGTALDLKKAADLLEADGWTLNNGVRTKNMGGSDVALNLTMFYPDGYTIGDLLKTYLADNLATVGINLTLEAVKPDSLLEIYYSSDSRACDMIYLATNFDVCYDPTATVEKGSCVNYTRIEDECLYELALNMRATEPGDAAGYCEKWIQFQQRWMEVLPAIPLYSNVYFDFSTPLLQDYKITEWSSWGDAVSVAYLSDGMVQEPEIPEPFSSAAVEDNAGSAENSISKN